MPRLFVAISSCQLYEDKGWSRPMRDTWLPEAVRLGIDYKFFYGRGATEKSDVVIVDADDAYYDLTTKTKAKVRWTLAHGYDFMFSCLADCYASPERLLGSGFEGYDYFGDVYCHPGGKPYCQGGPGYFLSRKAMEILDQEPSNYSNDDTWVGDVLFGHDIRRGDSKNFVWLGHLPGMSPVKGSERVAAHLSNADGGYRPELMYQKHQEYLDSYK